jgi:hypothetical protein
VKGCASRTSCQLGDPRAFVTRLVARADAAPIPSSRAGDDRPADGADSADARYLINCNDSSVGPTDEQIRATARAMARDYPLFGAHNTFNLFACKAWQPQRSVLEPPVAATPNRLLVVGTVTTQPRRTPAQ